MMIGTLHPVCLAEVLSYAAPLHDPRWLAWRAWHSTFRCAIDEVYLLSRLKDFFDLLQKVHRSMFLHRLLVMACHAGPLRDEKVLAALLAAASVWGLSTIVVREIEHRVVSLVLQSGGPFLCWPHASPMKYSLRMMERHLTRIALFDGTTVETNLSPFIRSLCESGDWVVVTASGGLSSLAGMSDPHQLLDSYLAESSTLFDSAAARGPFFIKGLSDSSLAVDAYVSTTDCVLCLPRRVTARDALAQQLVPLDANTCRVLDLAMLPLQTLAYPVGQRVSFVEHIYFPRTLTHLAQDSFVKMKRLQKIDLQHCEGLKTVVTFQGVPLVSTVRLPPNVVSVSGLRGMSSVTSIDLSPYHGLRCLDGFHHCPALQSVRWPPRLEEVGAGALVGCGISHLDFRTCANLRRVLGCGCMAQLRRVDFPVTLREVGALAFCCCEALELVSFEECSCLESVAGFTQCPDFSVILPRDDRSKVKVVSNSEAIRRAVQSTTSWSNE